MAAVAWSVTDLLRHESVGANRIRYLVVAVNIRELSVGGIPVLQLTQ